MKNIKRLFVLILTLCLLSAISGCKTETTQIAKKRQTVTSLQCISPSALNNLYPISDDTVLVCWSDYENERTTVLLADVNKDAVLHENTIDGVWDFKEQSFSDGRFVLCRRETNTWKFLNNSLEELGEWKAENVDGFFSADASYYYFLRERILYRQSVVSGECVKVELDLRLLELTAFDSQSGTLVMQFFLSPYSSECGTAVYNINTGTFSMLKKDRYRVFFSQEEMCLMAFDNEKMGYSVTYGIDDRFLFADADVFSDTGGYLYKVSGSPYLIGIATGCSVLYAADKQITSCLMSDFGIDGEMHTACYLPDSELLVGAVYQEGSFRLYVIDTAQLTFAKTADAESITSPFAVDGALTEYYWNKASDTPVVESLQEARRYADTLEEKYGIQILLSSQCKDAAKLCDMPLTLTDTMSADEELNGIRAMLEALDYSLALYPEGYHTQFRTGAGDGGLCFLLVSHIENKYSVEGCTYERYEWQYIALDVTSSYSFVSVICHELWHATENFILSQDYTALPMDEWDSLNPENFSYTDYDTRKDPTYPYFLYTSVPKNIRFVDNYSCVNRQEDRARIMEYFMTYEEEAQILIQSPFIRRKLEIMCDTVRRAFDTTGWENVRWEQLL